jgi:DNA-binding NarL/FixJ family response regulator
MQEAMLSDSMTSPIRVLAVDDHPLVRAGLVAVLGGEAGMLVVGEAASGEEAVQQHAALQPDVVLMDLRMPGMGGLEAIRAIRRTSPTARIIALTTYDGDADIQRALEAGASGYLLKDMLTAAVVDAVHAVAAGARVVPAAVAQRLADHVPRADLTARELEVLALASRGLTNRDVARVVGRSEETVKSHVASILAKLGAADRTEAVTIAIRRGILHLD